jgi:hypothetical protein
VPARGGNVVEVRYRVNQGAEQVVRAAWFKNDSIAKAQYFRAVIPAATLQPGDEVEYAAMCRFAGREDRLPWRSFTIVLAAKAAGMATIADGVGGVLAAGVGAYTVSGTVSSSVMPPIPGLLIHLVDNNVGSDPTALATTRTANDGSYAFHVTIPASYLPKHHKAAPDLQVQVTATNGGPVLASSVIRYQASPTENLDVVLPPGAAGLPSEYELLAANLQGVYTGDLAALEENQSRRDITYLANTTGWDARAVAFAAQAAQLAKIKPAAAIPASVPTPLLYALLRAGVGADPDVLFGTPVTTVKSIWSQAISQNLVPAYPPESIAAAATAFTAIATSRALNAAPMPGTSTLGELLQHALGGDTGKQQTFAALLTMYRDDPTTLWQQTSRAFGAKTTAALQLDGKLAYLTVNNAPLMAALHQANEANPLASTLDLATRGYYQASAWEQLLARANIAPPPNVGGATIPERTAPYAELLAAQVRLAYPTATVAHLVATHGLGITDSTHQNAVADFLNTNQATFDVGAEPVAQFLARTNMTLDATATAHVQRIQRVYQITPSHNALSVLTAGGVDSAHAVVRMGRPRFAAQFGDSLGGADVVNAISGRALTVHATTLHITLAYVQARRAALFPNPQAALVNPAADLDGEGTVKPPTPPSPSQSPPPQAGASAQAPVAAWGASMSQGSR